MNREIISIVVACVCGLTLLAAVALKVQGDPAVGVKQTLSVLSPQVQYAGMGTEAIVGLWLLGGFARRGAWLAGVALFTLLAVVSVYLASVGQVSCGCFGSFKVSPWWTLALDLACMVSLLVAHPPEGSVGVKATLVRYCGIVACGIVLLVGASSQTGEAWLARLWGDVIAVVPGEADAGEASAGTVRVIRVVVVNRSSEDVRLIGGSVSCNCMAAEGLPVTVPAMDRTEVEVKIKFGGSPGRFAHRFEYFTALPNQPRVVGRLIGTVVESQP